MQISLPSIPPPYDHLGSCFYLLQSSRMCILQTEVKKLVQIHKGIIAQKTTRQSSFTIYAVPNVHPQKDEEWVEAVYPSIYQAECLHAAFQFPQT